MAVELKVDATVADVPLDQIRLEGDTNARVAINGHTVNEYAEAMTEGASFPPVILFRDAAYWVGDGHHRCRAARQAGFTIIRAKVRTGGEREAFLYACSANATHGLRPDDLDKRHAVRRLLTDEEWGRWSDREIARRCAVSHPLVGKIRAELEKRGAARGERLTGNVSSERTYTCRSRKLITSAK
jgi:ParB-like nuclease domain